MSKIIYRVEDTFDANVKNEENIFAPAGTNFEKDINFVFNNGGVFGCFEGM